MVKGTVKVAVIIRDLFVIIIIVNSHVACYRKVDIRPGCLSMQ